MQVKFLLLVLLSLSTCFVAAQKEERKWCIFCADYGRECGYFGPFCQSMYVCTMTPKGKRCERSEFS
ncbi:unnamed protein product [Caenorhabditis auriculariae]|uniref:Uncharacterized protein n=1 Tax=Caenorhabditis auriculariae TaxID=2777116 RepID=A0A8S1H1X6_9PELO|nr:unnamed protein product [Caenorhabditis auriculariae]